MTFSLFFFFTLHNRVGQDTLPSPFAVIAARTCKYVLNCIVAVIILHDPFRWEFASDDFREPHMHSHCSTHGFDCQLSH